MIPNGRDMIQIWHQEILKFSVVPCSLEVLSKSVRQASSDRLLISPSCSEEELRNIFMRYGMVQSAIVNRDKRHAFVKMCNRHDAVRAKVAMEDPGDPVVADKVRKVCRPILSW